MPSQGQAAAVAERLEMLGGKGANQAVALAQLGIPVALDVSFVARRAGTRTALIVSMVDPGGWHYLEDIPEATLISEQDVAAAAGLIDGGATVLIQLQQPPAVTLAAALAGRRAGCRVVIDGAPVADYRDSLLASATVVAGLARGLDPAECARRRGQRTPGALDPGSGLKMPRWVVHAPMAALTDIKDKLASAARVQQTRYAGDQDRPLRGYAMTMTTYGGVLCAVTAAVRLSNRQVPDGFSPADITLCALATHKLSRLLAKDPVTSPLRAPFTSYQGTTGPAELHEDVRGQGGRKAVGELVTCPFCTGVWVATGLATGLIFFPRATRVARDTLAMLAGADLLQFAHAVLRNAAQS